MNQNADRRAILDQIYREYATAAVPFKSGAVCGEGCDFCCTHYGMLDVTTLEDR